MRSTKIINWSFFFRNEQFRCSSNGSWPWGTRVIFGINSFELSKKCVLFFDSQNCVDQCFIWTEFCFGEKCVCVVSCPKLCFVLLSPIEKKIVLNLLISFVNNGWLNLAERVIWISSEVKNLWRDFASLLERKWWAKKNRNQFFQFLQQQNSISLLDWTFLSYYCWDRWADKITMASSQVFIVSV